MSSEHDRSLDITERKRAEEHAELLRSELHHRVKNIFALIAALIDLTRSEETSVMAYANRLRARMESLMIAHELSFADSASEVSILELLNRLLDPWRGLRRDPIAISGDKALMLAGRVVTSVALILHELATNSVKYGGLGHAEGALRIAVEHAGDDRGSARLLWVEERPGLEEVRTASGFGTRLVERSVAHIGGTLSRRVATGRLEIELVLPIVIDRI